MKLQSDRPLRNTLSQLQVAVNMFSLGNVVLALSAHDQLLVRSGDIGDLNGANDVSFSV